MLAKCIAAAIIVSNLITISAAYSTQQQQSSLKASFASMPLAFTENNGQWPDSILYRASAGGATMWFTNTGVLYQLTKRIPRGKIEFGEPHRTSTPVDKLGNILDSVECTMIKASFVGANLNPCAEGLSLLEYKCNYFIGNEPDNWRTDVPNYELILYKEIYPGIDLKYYGNGKQMEYDFIVSPGANYSQIQIRYDGAESLSIGDNGELIIRIADGEIIEQPPIVFQMIDGRKVNLEGEYLVGADNTFSFGVDKRYNSAHELVIDPILVYSTYLGGGTLDYGTAIVVDAAGAAYVVGRTLSTNFPTFNPYQGTYGGGTLDGVVSKLNSAGNSLVYSTYLGGSLTDYVVGIAVDTAGAAYITGNTRSTNFPILNAYQGTNQGGAGGDAFVTKLSSGGNSLIYSTYLGGSVNDAGVGIEVDASGSAYVLGQSSSSNFPTLNPYQTDQGGWDSFITKFSSAGSSLIYSTYLGGSADDFCNALSVDAAGAAYVAGHTNSTNYPIFNQYQSNQDSADVFVTKLSSSGDGLIYSTYLGGGGEDYCYGLAVDTSGASYLTGYTSSTNFPLVNQFQSNQDSTDGFVAKLSKFGLSLDYSTYLGGSGNDYSNAIAVDNSGAAYITGLTTSPDFPIQNPYQGSILGVDAFVTKVSSAGNSIVYSTFLGGNGSSGDYGYGIAVDDSGAAYVTGGTTSTNFPTLDPYQGSLAGSTDVFVTKFLDDCCIGIRGDVNNDGTDANILDLTFLVDRIFRGGPAPACPEEADVNSDGAASNILDLTFLVDRIFRGGPAPGPC